MTIKEIIKTLFSCTGYMLAGMLTGLLIVKFAIWINTFQFMKDFGNLLF